MAEDNKNGFSNFTPHISILISTSSFFISFIFSFLISFAAAIIDFIFIGLSYLFAYTLPNEYKIYGIFFSWPLGWAVGMLISILAYKLGRWKKLIGYEKSC